MDMCCHYFFLEVFDLIKAFFKQSVNLVFLQFKQSNVCSPASKNSYIAVFYRIAMDILNAVKLCKEISCSNSLVIAWQNKDFFVSFFEGTDNIIGRSLHHCQVPA